MGETEEMPSLPEAQKRFLETVMASARTAGVIDNAGLFKKFPQKRLFEAYKDEPKSRAKLLAANSKMPFEIAEHLDVAGCLQVFDIALDKLKEATPDKVFEVVTPAELVRVMDNKELWEFVEATKWWETNSPANRVLMRELLAACKALKLGGDLPRTLHAIEDDIGIDNYVEHLPKAVLTEVIRTARRVADQSMPEGMPFTVDVMADAAGTDVLSEHLPLPILVRPIHGFVKAAGWIVDPPKVETPPPPVDEKPAAVATPPDDDADDRTPTIPPAKKADGDNDEPIIEIGKADGAASDPDEDDVALDDLLRGQAEKDKEEKKPDGDKALELDDDEDAQTRVGAIPRPQGSPPPLPPKGGQTTGRRRG